MFIDRNTAVFFDLFGIEYIPQEVLSKIKDKGITLNIIRIQSDDSIMYEFYCKTIEYTIAGTKLLDYNYLFFPNVYQGDEKIIYKYFKDKYGKRKSKP